MLTPGPRGDGVFLIGKCSEKSVGTEESGLRAYGNDPLTPSEPECGEQQSTRALPLGPFPIPLNMNFLLLNHLYNQRPF